MEFINEAESDRLASVGETLTGVPWKEEDYVKNLRRAIQCLALAIIKEE